MPNAPLPPPLPDDMLARRAQLPAKPEAVTLSGQRIRLQPLDLERDAEMLYRLTNGAPITLGERYVDAYDADDRVWRYMAYGPFADAAELAQAMQAVQAAPDGCPLTVVDLATETPVGVVNYMANVPAHLKIELGGIWYSPIAQRTGANTEATYLMLRHAFELGYRRVEWKCNALNLPSWQAAEKMGFKFEGIQENHVIIKNRNRDTAWFRILDREWPEVRARLEARLSRVD
jgi:RimJ/RimL family protein N-acetyltransferase